MSRGLFELIFIGVFGLVGLVFLCIGIGITVSGNRLKKVCTKPVTGTIIDIERSDTRSSDGTRMVSWYPVYEYYTNGATIQKRAAVGRPTQDFYKGQKVTILVNPENPNDFYCPEEKRGLLQGIFLGIGIVFLIIAIGIFVVLHNFHLNFFIK